MATYAVLLLCSIILPSARATIAIHDFTVDLSNTGQTFDTMREEYNLSAFRLHLLPDRDRQYDWNKVKNYDPNMTVGLHIRVPPEMRLLFTSLSMNIACGDYVAISEGELASQPFKQLLMKGCGDSPQDAVTTSGRDAYIRFHSNEDDDVGVKFSLIVTPFSLGPCDEFYCDNGRCIDSSLSCNFNDNCGDNSNNNGCMSAYPEHNMGVKMLFGVMMLFSGLIVVSVIVCCCCQKTKGQRGSVIKASGQVQPAVYQNPTLLLGPEYWNRVPNHGPISFNIPPQKSQIVYAVGLNMHGDSALETPPPEKPPID